MPVTVATVERRPVPFELAAAGTVEPLQRVNVEAQISGQLLRIGFQEGDQVTKGQVLFEIDSRPYRAALAAAEAMVARDVIQAQNAQRDVERYGALVKQEYVTSQQYDAMRASAAAMEATVKADSAAMETARLNLQYATIRAPIGGLAGSLQIREGIWCAARAPHSLPSIRSGPSWSGSHSRLSNWRDPRPSDEGRRSRGTAGRYRCTRQRPAGFHGQCSG